MTADMTPGWAGNVVSMLADGRAVPVDQLVERTGVRRGELLTFLQQHPRLLETGSGWVDALGLADGVGFTHELSAVERETGVLAADDDLALWAVLAQEGLPLAAGGQVWAHPLPELPSGVRSHLPSGGGLIGQGLVGPDGWLTGFHAGNLLAVGLHDGVLAVRTTQPPQYRGERVAALYAACAAAIEEATRRYRDGDGEIPAADLAEMLAELLVTFAQRTVLAEPLGLLINRCGGDLQAVLLCIDLLLTHEGALDRFLRTRGGWLRDDERRLIEAWAPVPIGAFEIREVRPGIGVTVRLLPSGESLVLADRKLSSCVHRLDLFCGRILHKQTRRQLLGMPAPVARHRRQDLLDLLASNPTADQIAAFLGPQPTPYLVNSDGHEYLDAELVVQVPGDAGAAWQRLATRLVGIDRDTLERHDERDGKTTALGRVTRMGRQWTLSANSRERLAALESLVRIEVSGTREISRRAERLGSPLPRDGRRVRTMTIDNYLVPGNGDPDDQRAWDHLLRDTRESWVDETIDVLSMSPRQAANAGGAARAELEAVLDDMQWTNDRYRDRGKPPTMDVAWIRNELGIPA